MRLEKFVVLRWREKFQKTSKCSTNYCRFLPQIASFACSVSGDSLLINIPAASAGNVNLKNASLQFELSGSYPYDGSGSLEILEASGECTIALRIQGWCRNWTLALNGKPVSDSPEKGYVRMRRAWKKGDRIEWNFDMPVRVLHANPRVSADIGRAAILRGPLVYALESVDNSAPLELIRLKKGTTFTVKPAEGLPDGTVAISGDAMIQTDTDQLYFESDLPLSPGRFTAIPSALWQNRGDSSMRIWIPEAE